MILKMISCSNTLLEMTKILIPFIYLIFIEGILNISCKSITILNPDLVVENIEDKDMLLDIRVQTNTGDYVNIEMFSKNQYQRFQIYGASLLSRQEKEGDDYQKNINHVYQIIFIDDIDKTNLKLYDCYESRNEEGNKMVEIMKGKIDRFNQDEQLRDMAYKRSLNCWANERDKQDMYEKGKEEGIKQGIIEKSKEKTKQLFICFFYIC